VWIIVTSTYWLPHSESASLILNACCVNNFGSVATRIAYNTVYIYYNDVAKGWIRSVILPLFTFFYAFMFELRLLDPFYTSLDSVSFLADLVATSSDVLLKPSH
jgi:hypothetical protein